MTTAAAQRARYAGTALATASPQVLLLRLYDRLVLDLERAAQAMGAGDLARANRELQHGQEIVVSLTSALDLDEWEGARQLRSLYVWVLQEMVRANTTRDISRIQACLSVVEPLRATWHEAHAQLTGGVSEVVAPAPAEPAAPTLSAGGPSGAGARIPLPANRAGAHGTGPVTAAALLRARTLSNAGGMR